MRKLTNSLAAVGRIIFSPVPLLLLPIPLSLTSQAAAQSKTDTPGSKELYERIAALDAAQLRRELIGHSIHSERSWWGYDVPQVDDPDRSRSSHSRMSRASSAATTEQSS